MAVADERFDGSTRGDQRLSQQGTHTGLAHAVAVEARTRLEDHEQVVALDAIKLVPLLLWEPERVTKSVAHLSPQASYTPVLQRLNHSDDRLGVSEVVVECLSGGGLSIAGHAKMPTSGAVTNLRDSGELRGGSRQCVLLELAPAPVRLGRFARDGNAMVRAQTGAAVSSAVRLTDLSCPRNFGGRERNSGECVLLRARGRLLDVDQAVVLSRGHTDHGRKEPRPPEV